MINIELQNGKTHSYDAQYFMINDKNSSLVLVNFRYGQASTRADNADVVATYANGTYIRAYNSDKVIDQSMKEKMEKEEYLRLKDKFETNE